MKVDVIVPIKGESIRVPNKNFRHLNGKQLWKHIVETLQSCKHIDTILIDTDVPEKFKDMNEEKINIIRRPKHLQGNDVSVNRLIEYDIEYSDKELLMQTHTTNPLLTKETIDECIRSFTLNNLQSAFGITEHKKRFWKGKKPINFDSNKLIKSQDLEPVYEDNSCIYLFTKSFFKKHRVRNNEQSHMFIIPPEESLDIDTEFDWRLVECLTKQ